MKNNIFLAIAIVFSALVLISCGSSDTASPLRPSQKIGPMWVNRYGHTNSEFLWDHCDGSMTEKPGIQKTECTVPQVDELFIGYGVRGVDKGQRDALWAARTWELYIDGHAVDLPAFNIADFDAQEEGKTFQYRLWRIRLREIPVGQHTLQYVMHVNQEVEDDPESQAVGRYELILNFTFGTE
jgi:hypothetical protein